MSKAVYKAFLYDLRYPITPQESMVELCKDSTDEILAELEANYRTDGEEGSIIIVRDKDEDEDKDKDKDKDKEYVIAKRIVKEKEMSLYLLPLTEDEYKFSLEENKKMAMDFLKSTKVPDASPEIKKALGLKDINFTKLELVPDNVKRAIFYRKSQEYKEIIEELWWHIKDISTLEDKLRKFLAKYENFLPPSVKTALRGFRFSIKYGKMFEKLSPKKEDSGTTSLVDEEGKTKLKKLREKLDSLEKEKTESEEKLKEKEKKETEQNELIESLNKEVEEFKKELEELKKKFDDSESNHRETMSKIMVTSKEKEEGLKSANDENGKLRENQKIIEASIVRLKAEHAAEMEKLNKEKGEMEEELKEEMEDLKKRLKEKEEGLEKLSNINKGLNENLEDMEVNINKLKAEHAAEMEKLNKEKGEMEEELKKEINLLENKVSVFEESEVSFSGKNEGLKKNLEELREEKEEMEKRLKKEIDDLKETSKEKEEGLETLSNKNKDLNKELEDMEARINKLKAEHVAEMEKLNKEIDDLKKDRETKEEELTKGRLTLERQIRVTKEKEESSVKLTRDKEEAIQALRLEIDQKNKSISELTTEVNRLNGLVKPQGDEISRLTATNRKLMSEDENNKRRIQELELKCTGITAEADRMYHGYINSEGKLRRKIEELEGVIQQQRSEASRQSEGEVAQLRREADALRGEVARLTREGERMIGEVARLRAEDGKKEGIITALVAIVHESDNLVLYLANKNRN